MSQQVSRRAVARGAAWAVPVVAVSVGAPAFAASIAPPSVSFPSTSPNASTKCPGQDTYNLVVQFGSAAAAYQVTLLAISFIDPPPGHALLATGPMALPAGGGQVVFRFRTVGNSKGSYTLAITYRLSDAAGATLGDFTSAAATVDFGPHKNGEAGSCP